MFSEPMSALVILRFQTSVLGWMRLCCEQESAPEVLKSRGFSRCVSSDTDNLMAITCMNELSAEVDVALPLFMDHIKNIISILIEMQFASTDPCL